MNKNYLTKYQTGAAIMITLSCLLLICSLLTLSSIKTIKTQGLISRNKSQAEQAFAAAESGLDYSIAFLKINTDLVHSGKIESYQSALTQNVGNGNNSLYSIDFSYANKDNHDLLIIQSTGRVANGKTPIQLSQLVQRKAFIANSPKAGFITLGKTSLSGNITISNYETDITIWSGGDVQLSGSATTEASAGVGSNKRVLDVDIIANDSRLSKLSPDQFFEQMMGMPRDYSKSQTDIQLTYNANQNLSHLLSHSSFWGKSIWITQTKGTASLSGRSVIGSPEKPIILIIDGDFKANGTTDIYGLVYVTQNWDNSGGGTLNIYGAAIVEGDFNGTGTPNINYDQDVLDNLNLIANFAKIPGSWSDF